jgi:carboxypeptidase Taq
MTAYQDIAAHFATLGALRRADRLLRWDRSVFMPPQGVGQRAREIAALNVQIHALTTAPWLQEALALVDERGLDEWQGANLRLMRRQVLLAAAVPADLLSRKLAQEIRTEMCWRQARAENDFAALAPELEALLPLVRDYAEARAAALQVPAYDALMTHYLPDMSAADVDVIFDDLADFLPPLLARIAEVQPEPLPIEGPFDVALQQKAAALVAQQRGFGLGQWGRLDVSAHPFSTGDGDDVRITTRYDAVDFMSALQATAHEVGHGFYDHHVPAAWIDQPVGVSGNMGMGIHESQSLGLEMQMARSREYWHYLAPLLAGVFGGAGEAWSGENLYRHATRVRPGLIRIEADEATYPLHIILRYRLEKDLLAGRLAVRDLPDAWRAGHQALLGVAPQTDADGCMQDIHWHGGMFGYFPAYAIGAVTAAQLTARFKAETPDFAARLAAGDFFCYTAWMRDHVQSKACLYTPDDLIRRVTGGPLSAGAFKQHLTERYLAA